MIKKLLAASAVAALVASPALAMSNKAPTGTSASHVRAEDSAGGYTSSGNYIRPHDRTAANDSFWRVNPITGGAALAFAPVAGVVGIDTGYGSYAQADGYGAASPTAISNGQPVGWDPDPNVQLELLRGSVRYQ
jgi:hypothetical protein